MAHTLKNEPAFIELSDRVKILEEQKKAKEWSNLFDAMAKLQETIKLKIHEKVINKPSFETGGVVSHCETSWMKWTETNKRGEEHLEFIRKRIHEIKLSGKLARYVLINPQKSADIRACLSQYGFLNIGGHKEFMKNNYGVELIISDDVLDCQIIVL